MQIYYSSQFAPLVVFFLLFLSVVKNNKLPHFVRFNCMQGIMIDIVVMLFNILRAYFPAELRWSAVLHVRTPNHSKLPGIAPAQCDACPIKDVLGHVNVDQRRKCGCRCLICSAG